MASFSSYFPVLLYHNILNSITIKYDIEHRCLCSPQNVRVFLTVFNSTEKKLFSHPYKDSYINENNPAEEHEIYTIYDCLSMYVTFIFKKKLQNQFNKFVCMCLLFSDITKMQSQQSKASPNPNSPVQPESTGPRQQQRKVQQKKKKKGGKW